jgi:hypothetical protein
LPLGPLDFIIFKKNKVLETLIKLQYDNENNHDINNIDNNIDNNNNINNNNSNNNNKEFRM